MKETKEQLAKSENAFPTSIAANQKRDDGIRANMVAMEHAMAGDRVPKNTFANNALEHYEIAASRS